jgi:hypothetical protein
MENTTHLLAIPAESSALQDELMERTVDHIDIILMGAKQWKSE